jgi:hypothetical protein
MKKNIQLGKAISKKDQTNVKGGVAVSCTYTVTCPDKTSTVSCTSSTGECSYIYLGDTKVGVKCEGKEFKCNDGRPKDTVATLDQNAFDVL